MTYPIEEMYLVKEFPKFLFILLKRSVTIKGGRGEEKNREMSVFTIASKKNASFHEF